MADIFIGNVKGPQGATGATGSQGPQGDAATIAVGSVTTVPYGQNASVVNSGTTSAAVLDFTIPQGRPGEQTTKLDNLTIDAITVPATEFPVPAVGDNGSTLFGKISKWFSDMAALVATKLNASNVVNNLTTTSSGYALDARQGKAIAGWFKVLSNSYTISDSTYGFVEVPISAATYVIVGGLVTGASNKSLRFSNLGANNYRFQVISALDGTADTSGTVSVSIYYMPQSTFSA